MPKLRTWVCWIFAPALYAVVTLCGCNGDAASELTATETANANATANSKPILEDWKKPAVTIALTGEQFGYLEPCGCSANQSGGLSRRANLFQKLKERQWPYMAFDLGGTIIRNREQTQHKFQTTLDAYLDMNYTALALGPQELRLGAPQLLSRHRIDDPDNSVTFLAANVALFGSREIPEAPKSWKLVTVNGLRIGVTSVLGLSYKRDVLPPGGESDEITIEPPEAVLPEVVKSLEAEKSDLLVLLSHATAEETKALVQQFPMFDLVLSAGGADDPLDDNPLQLGKTTLVFVGHKGKYVGVIGFYPDDPDNRFRFELIELDQKRFQDTPKMHAHMQAYQDLLRELDIAANEARDLAIGHPSGAKFVGAEKCGECHTLAYEKWKTTPHSHAFESLIRGREGQQLNWISRIYDPECIACHVVGWHPQDIVPYKSGFIDKATTPGLIGVQCENCHGPGSRHIDLVEQDELVAARKLVRVTVPQARDKLCYKCHDLDNSPGFDFEKYWPKIEHPGLD